MILRKTIRADLEDVAALHREALPRSLFTALGRAALIRYYAYCEASAHEVAWTATDAGRVVGACVVSLAPDTVLRRFVAHAPLAFARELASLTVSDRTVREKLAARLREKGSDVSHAPEITQIFVDQRQRSQGLGSALLRTCEAHLRSRCVARYYVHTERDDNNAGIRFYRREGFTPIGESRSFGQAFVVMQKDLP